jgi:hypothetical protein
MSRKIGAGLVLQASRLDYEFALAAAGAGPDFQSPAHGACAVGHDA